MTKHRRYKVTDDQFGRLVWTLRENTHLTQAELATALGLSDRSIQQWEAGATFPAVGNLKKLIAAYLHHGAFVRGRERDEAHALWEQVTERSPRHKASFDATWFDSLLAQSAELPMGSANDPTTRRYGGSTPSLRRADWGDAPDAAAVYGREHDLHTLAQWVLADQCRVIGVLGLGGIGKTTLAVRFAQVVAPQFTYVVWRSLRNAPPLAELLTDCLHTLAEHLPPPLPSTVDHGISLLIDLLRQHRCLLVLDNTETLLEAGSLAGQYRAGYEAYKLLFQRVAETAHRSCLMFTSREMLSELEHLEGAQAPVRVLKLTRLTRAASQEVLKDKELCGTPEAWDSFTEYYAGNPLALKIAAATVRDLFGGDLAAFLQAGPMTLHTLQQFLDTQLERLSPLERDVITWLAIERDMVSLEELGANVTGTVLKKDLLAALKSLRRRALVERDERGTAFTLQPVVLEHVSDWLVTQMGRELIDGHFRLTTKYALLKSQSKDYIRESQVRMLVQPLLYQLQAHLGDALQLERQLLLLLQRLRDQPQLGQGYAGGNIVNLLICLRGHLRGVDCSRLPLRQVNIQGVEAQGANFAGADVHEARFTAPLETIASMALSPDGTHLAIGGFSGQVQVWQVAKSELLWAAKGHTRMAWALAFSPDGAVLASGGYQGRVCLWQVASGRRLATLQAHTRWVRSVAFSADGDRVVTAGDDAAIRIWDIRSGMCIRVLEGHGGIVWSAVFSPDNVLILSGGGDGTLRVWDAQTGAALSVAQQPAGIFAVAMHPQGALFASSCEDGQVTLWDLHSGQRHATLPRHATGIASLAFNPSGTLLACGSSDGVVELWEMEGENARHYVGTIEGHRWLVSSVAFASQNLLASVAYGGQVKLWDAQRGKVLKTIQGYSRLITALSFSPDGSLLAQGEDNGMVRVWDVRSGHCLRSIQGHVGPVWAITWRSDGKTFATGGDDRDVLLWDAHSGHCLKRFGGHYVVLWALAFSPDGTMLASGGSDKLIRLYTVAGEGDGSQPTTLDGSSDWIMSLAFRADGRVLASGQLNGTIQLWDVTSRRGITTLHHSPGAIGALFFSADGSTLISSSNDEVLKWWDTARGQLIQSVPDRADGNWVKAFAFSKNGMLLVTGSGDKAVQLWRVQRASAPFPATRLAGHTGQIWAVAVSDDERVVASADDHGTILVWDVQTKAVLHRLTTERPYERMNITSITGISEAQRAALKALGAVEESTGVQAE